MLIYQELMIRKKKMEKTQYHLEFALFSGLLS